MPEKPLIFVKIDDLAKHVQNTLLRAEDPLPPSLIRQLGGLISHCLRHHIAGDDAHPGLRRMASMGRCSERQARRNLRQLEAWLVMCPTRYGNGGRWATRYWMDVSAIKRATVAMGCNPSPALIEKISDILPDLRADIRADIRGGHVSGLHVRRYTDIDTDVGDGGCDD